MPQPYELTIAEAASQIRAGQLSPVELMESLLRRSEKLEPSLNVWVTLDSDFALETARQRELELAVEGPRGPLHGIPVGIKDIYYTRGMRTTCCSPIYADFVPDYDATTVALLRRAGAIIMGKTVTTQFACGDPPPTKNPWNAAHTPGGSSSGSAVGVAARMFPAALGSQTAGSVLRPAAYNGVVGLKPTFGRISRHGVVPVSWSLDTMGTFTRTVEDAALMLGALAGHDPKDASTSTVPIQDYAAVLDRQQFPPRVGLLRKFFYERANAEVRQHTDQIAQRLAAAGAMVEEVKIPMDFDTVISTNRVLMTVECAAYHQPVFSERPDDYAPNVRGVIEAGMIMPAVTYMQAQRNRRRFRRLVEEAAQGFDVLLTPSIYSAAPRDLSSTGDPMFQSPWTTCGIPAITLPSGLSESGLPLGIQLAAAPFDEAGLLAAARWCERVLKVELATPDAS